MATDRDRCLQTQYDEGDKYAKMRMAVDAIVYDDGSHRSAAILCCDLIALAATIERSRIAIEGLNPPAPDISAAAECIQDISLSLRKNAVEAVLCDSLHAAARKICDAWSSHQAARERAHQVAEQLRGISDHVDDMVALLLARFDAKRIAVNHPINTSVEPDPVAANKVESDSNVHANGYMVSSKISVAIESSENGTFNKPGAISAVSPSDTAQPRSDQQCSPAASCDISPPVSALAVINRRSDSLLPAADLVGAMKQSAPDKGDTLFLIELPQFAARGMPPKNQS